MKLPLTDTGKQEFNFRHVKLETSVVHPSGDVEYTNGIQGEVPEGGGVTVGVTSIQIVFYIVRMNKII